MQKENKLPFFSAVIFDMDGLVLDTESSYFEAWRFACQEMGFQLTESDCLTLSGLHFQAVKQKLTEMYGADFDSNRFNQLSGNYWRQIVNQNGISIKKGFVNLLAELHDKNIPFCLASNSLYKNVVECLALSGLSHVFSILVTRDQVKHGKPAADLFLLAAENLKQPILKCLVLEDSATGLQAAVAAGAISVLIPSLTGIEKSYLDMADFVFDDLDQLAQIIHSS